MPKAPLRSAWQRYGVAVALTCLVVLLRMGLNPWWGHHRNRHLVLLPAVMVSAWLGGFGPGLLSGVLTTLALYVFWAEAPEPHLQMPTSDLGIYLALCAVLCALIASLQRVGARADAATRSRERVLQIVAHDLRSPLTSIQMVTDLIGREAPALEPQLKKITRAVERMDKLLVDLVDTTKIERGQLAMSPRPEPVAAILREAGEQYVPQAQAHEIALSIDDGSGEAAVLCDRVRIMQVLGNLIGNALKFTPAGGKVVVAARPRAGMVSFAVTDTGRGIPAQDQPHVFERYWRGDEKGTGLGLFIARTIVAAHGGQIAVESKVGAGTTFTFTLPAASPPGR
jgi:signal transduction histidine kinase